MHEKVDDGYVGLLADAVAGSLGGKVGIAPRVFLKKLVADVLDRVDQFDSFDPRQDYALTLSAGGKTEAAMFPLLTRMEAEEWPGLSLLYVCPLKALLNNVHPRVERYAGWLGRSAGIRHGDVGAGARRRQASTGLRRS